MRWAILMLCVVALPLTSCLEEEDLNNALSEEEVVAGLKEALVVGTDSTVLQVSTLDGYLKNELIKIALPEEAQPLLQSALNNPLAGPLLQPLVDQTIESMNRAAEGAATKAKPIFVDAITGITIGDGFAILEGPDTAATSYLKTNTFTDLETAYTPDVTAAMTEAGVQDVWADVTSIYNQYNLTNPLTGTKLFGDDLPTDLSAHVTTKALDGLFVVVGQKETDIRNNLAARVTDLLRRVFGSLS